jgi:F-type H+-transporting ATPase subunit b
VLEFSVTFLITIVNITFLFLVLRKVLFGRVTKFMEDRSNKIQRDIDLAKFSNERAKALEAEYAEKIKASREEGQRIMQIARDKAEQECASLIAEAKASAEKILSAARAEIEAERLEAERELLKTTADLTIRAASAVLEENIDSDKNRKLVAKFLDSVGVA